MTASDDPVNLEDVYSLDCHKILELSCIDLHLSQIQDAEVTLSEALTSGIKTIYQKQNKTTDFTSLRRVNVITMSI